jgi:hypothetical protein
MIASERLAVPCIFNSRLPSSFVDEVDVITSELVLRGFIVCLDTEGAHDDFRRDDGLSPVYQEERRLSSRLTWRCPVTPQCAQKLINSLFIMLLEAVVGVSLETLGDFYIGSLHLDIALWMSNGCIIDLNTKVLAVPLECTAGIPNLQTMNLMNLTAGCLLILTMGVTFGHLVNLSMTM